MSKRRDISGHRFGRLVAVRRVGTTSGKSVWECDCDCGRKTNALLSDLTQGRTKSCGCLRKEVLLSQGFNNSKHGGSHSRLYTIWLGMRQRCSYKSSHAYKNYGGRGIMVCDEWKNSFESFRDWALSNGYRDNLTIDRINQNGPYSPLNCRWSTMEEQQNNRRNNHLLTVGGVTRTLSQWSKETGIASETLAWRIKAGWEVDSLFIPTSLRNRIIRKEMKTDA